MGVGRMAAMQGFLAAEQQLAQANTQSDELRRAIAIRDGCLEHANSVVAQLQEHKLHLHSIIDNFRAQQASSKSQLDLQARSLINKERHIFSLTEKIQRLQAESTHHQSSCEEALHGSHPANPHQCPTTTHAAASRNHLLPSSLSRAACAASALP